VEQSLALRRQILHVLLRSWSGVIR
jgi:hypothetical protein